MLRLYVTAAERDLIYEKMRLIDTDNLSAYLRKMAFDGCANLEAKIGMRTRCHQVKCG
jgi:hypothetical protein